MTTDQQEVLSKISAMIKEANQLALEIHRHNKTIKEFRQRKKNIEEQILQFMSNNAIPALEYNSSTVVLAETRIKKRPKKKDERIHDSLAIIREFGIENPEELLKELNEAKYAKEENIPVLKIKNNLQL